MRREEKKNSAMLIGLSYDHPELDEFLDASFKAAYKAVYVPHPDTKEGKRFLSDTAMLVKLAEAYDNFKTFIVKTPTDYMGAPRMVNLCTEIEIPGGYGGTAGGYCILGAVNLAQHFDPSLLPATFLQAVKAMEDYRQQAEQAASLQGIGNSQAANVQFGLGVYGLASWLGNHDKATYEEFNAALRLTLAGRRVESDLGDFAYHLVEAYRQAADWLEEHTNVIAAFCIQPTVSTAQRSLDYFGYNVSPEIQPVQGLPHGDAVTTIVKSEIKGDKTIHYHPNTPTIDQVPYEVYRETSELWQTMMDSTGLAHRHSHCFYGKSFTVDNLRHWYNSPVRSLYYRLPYKVNTDSMNKAQLWQDVKEGELGDFDLDAILNGGSVQMFGAIECECQN
jgi:hypothetical protein